MSALIRVLHPRAIAMVFGPLALGAAYFAVVAPPTKPGAYILTPEHLGYTLPASPPSDPDRAFDIVRSAALEDHRPEYFYLADPEQYSPPLDPASARLLLVASPTDASSTTPAAEVAVPITVAAVNPTLYTVRSPQFDGPWIRQQYEALSKASPVPTHAVLALAFTTVDGKQTVVFGLRLDRLW